MKEGVPIHLPRKEWASFGNVVKSAHSFKKNLKSILEIARSRNEKVLLLSFAFYVPENYSLDKFKAKLLSYRAHKSPIEIWGEPKNVITSIRIHNEIIRDIAKEYPDNGIFLDQANNMPKEGSYFNDICHLSPEGCKKFADNIIDTIINRILK